MTGPGSLQLRSAAGAPGVRRGRNLVVCCDGTSNEFGDSNTNVIRLVQSLKQDPQTQLVYYDPGVGTLPEPGLFSKPAKTISKWMGLAFGRGLVRNVEEAYGFLMQNWRPGDAVFLFGFSRGAYTVRVLAALLHQIGLLVRGQEQLLPYAIRLFRAVPDREEEDADARSRYWRLCGEFRNTFCQALPQQISRQFPVHFVGVWDTVSSVGWVWNPKTFAYTAYNPGIRIVRHAISLDERRAFFRQNLFRRERPRLDTSGNLLPSRQDVVERWFPGCHSDIGGGNPSGHGALWRTAFDWMVEEAGAAGIETDSAALERIRSVPRPPAEPWAEPINESLTWRWWPAEFFPKISPRTRMPTLGLFHSRVTQGAVLHESVLRRIREIPGYRPPNLPVETIQAILDLPQVATGATVEVPARRP